MSKKILIIVGVVVIPTILLLVLVPTFLMKGPDLSRYQYLKDPQISEKPDQKMLVVEATGDPNVAGKKAFALLFKTYFKTVKDGKMPAPRARWPQDLNVPKSEWIGLYALPLPETVEKLPDIKTGEGLTIYLDKWGYGEVAEILHIGPYSKETPTVERLKKYIADNSYQIMGPHEEEYLKGPGMFGPGNSEKYQTIIRYRIAKAQTQKK
jgi:hypothetical protein